MDKPWEDFNKEEILAAKKAAEEAEAVERARQKKRAQRKGKKYVEPEQPDADIPDTFIAKLIEPGAVHASDGRRFNSSSMRENVNTLIAEGEIQMKFLWRYIVEKGNFDFEGVGLVPVVYVGKIERSHKDYKTVANAIYIRPYLKHGSVGDVVKMLAGKKKSFYYKDDLLLGNANKFINWYVRLMVFVTAALESRRSQERTSAYKGDEKHSRRHLFHAKLVGVEDALLSVYKDTDRSHRLSVIVFCSHRRFDVLIHIDPIWLTWSITTYIMGVYSPTTSLSPTMDFDFSSVTFLSQVGCHRSLTETASRFRPYLSMLSKKQTSSRNEVAVHMSSQTKQEDMNSFVASKSDIPTSEFKRWMVNMAKKLASVPVFLSPEYREAIVTSRIQKPQYFVEKLSPFKNDVFCFGLVLLYLASMEEPVGFNESAKKCARAAEKLRQKGRQEDLIALISSMLTFNPRERPSWKDLLPTTERWQLQATDLLRGLGNLFGTTQTNPEDLYLDKDLRDADKMKSAAAANIKREEGDAACTIM
ncbi:protein kinase (incomplete catalytic triad) [Cystoisospora suis]|uniref:Protein kinase (Incomplete catalytic triad) n=1 Tax=Cystoisospora suis TaxID=483139 RepID=A0A2C6KJD9_9APIC|nr:protein kinase (incomplete catalytic triad) [Cystoisospora suis]